MDKLIKILHIDSNWKVIYILIRNGALVKTAVSLETAILLLKNQEFDLIVSEPQNLALLDRQQEIEKEIPEDLSHWMNHQINTGPIPDYQHGVC